MDYENLLNQNLKKVTDREWPSFTVGILNFEDSVKSVKKTDRQTNIQVSRVYYRTTERVQYNNYICCLVEMKRDGVAHGNQSWACTTFNMSILEDDRTETESATLSRPAE